MGASNAASAARHPAAAGIAAIAVRITPLSLAPAPACSRAMSTHDARRGGRAHVRTSWRSVWASAVARAPGARSETAKAGTEARLRGAAARACRNPAAGGESVGIVQAVAADAAAATVRPTRARRTGSTPPQAPGEGGEGPRAILIRPNPGRPKPGVKVPRL